MKKLFGILAAAALMAVATTASAVQTFIYTGSSTPPDPVSLCFVTGCSAGTAANDFTLTLVVEDLVTSISHNVAAPGSKPSGFVSITLDTKSSAAAPFTTFQTISDGPVVPPNVAPLFQEFELLIVDDIVRVFSFALHDPAGPDPRGGMNADTSFTFGVSATDDPTTCDPFGGGAGCALFQNPFINFESGPFNGAPIPVPAAAWLFGSALGLLGWIRRRQVS